VNARTLLPVLVPLAPAATVTARLPAAFAKIARRLDVEALTLEGELAGDGRAGSRQDVQP
jgi:hypothetical protein